MGTAYRPWQYLLIVAFAMMPGLSVFAVPGDVNGDGSADAIDVQIAINAVLGLLDNPYADLNCDGAIDAADVQLTGIGDIY